MRILIGTPVTGQVTIQYLMALRALENALNNADPAIKTDVMFGTASFMPFSRNAIASILLENASYTHLLFIDADISFRPEAVLKMIEADKDMIGCMYPKRALKLDALHRVFREVEDPRTAASIAYDYAAAEQLQKRYVDFAGKRHLFHNIENGLVKTLRLGMGLTLIKREVIEKMAQALPDLVVSAERASHYQAMGLKGRVLQCFTSVSVDNIVLSEDLSFCRRWTDDCRGEIWACVDQTISHTGDCTFTGNLQDRIAYEDRETLAILAAAGRSATAT